MVYPRYNSTVISWFILRERSLTSCRCCCDLIRMFHIRLLQRSALPLSPKIYYFLTFSHVYSSYKNLVTRNLRRLPSLQTPLSASSRIGWMSFSEGNRAADNNDIADEYYYVQKKIIHTLCFVSP